MIFTKIVDVMCTAHTLFFERARDGYKKVSGRPIKRMTFATMTLIRYTVSIQHFYLNASGQKYDSCFEETLRNENKVEKNEKKN